MAEYGYVEKPILEWLAGKLNDPKVHGLGWTYRRPEEMESFERHLTDPIVEALLIPAVMQINKAVDDEAKARKYNLLYRGLPNPKILHALSAKLL